MWKHTNGTKIRIQTESQLNPKKLNPRNWIPKLWLPNWIPQEWFYGITRMLKMTRFEQFVSDRVTINDCKRLGGLGYHVWHGIQTEDGDRGTEMLIRSKGESCGFAKIHPKDATAGLYKADPFAPETGSRNFQDPGVRVSYFLNPAGGRPPSGGTLGPVKMSSVWLPPAPVIATPPLVSGNWCTSANSYGACNALGNHENA